jgi:eukaryotic-like serine/threonine-protein kinase
LLPIPIIVRRFLTMGILVAVFFLSAVGVSYLALRGRTVQVPDVIGKTESQAESVLSDSGLRMDVRSRTHHDKIPANAVSDQSPSPGTTVKTGQLVRVSVSLGSQNQTAPAR